MRKQIITAVKMYNGRVMKLADMRHSKCRAERHVGSIPTSATDRTKRSGS